MMNDNCYKTIEALPDYLSDDIDSKTREFIEIHLKECSKCSAQLDNLRMTLDSFQYDAGFNASPDLETNIHKIIDSIDFEKQRKEFFRFKLIRGVAAVVAILMGTYLGINFGNEIIASQNKNDHFLEVFANDLKKDNSYNSPNILFNYFKKKK